LSGRILIPKNQKPYEPYDTGWTKCIYGLICLTWFLFSSGTFLHLISVGWHNLIFVPFHTLLSRLCELIGNATVAFGNGIVCVESSIFKQFNHINPIYNGIRRIESIFNSINIDMVTNKSNHKRPSGRQQKSSSGRHLCSFYACKRRHRQLHVIVPGLNQSKTDNHKKNKPKSVSHLVEEYDNIFHPIDDPSCQDTSWYDAVCPY
jgi:hypothetical protein